MLFLFQILFVLFSLFAMYSVLHRRREGLLGSKGFVFWIIFWCAVIIVVVWPNSAAQIARLFGIGRGADVVLYISIATLFYIVFKLHIKVESIGRDVTRIVRDSALQEHKKNTLIRTEKTNNTQV